MSERQQDAEPAFDATPHKLEQARRKGEIARSQDVLAAAAYAGLLLAAAVGGVQAVMITGHALMLQLDRGQWALPLPPEGPHLPGLEPLTLGVILGVWPFFAGPAVLVLAFVTVQNAWVLAPERLSPKLSRLSPIANARQKFGAQGLFEFAKSFAKLMVLSVCLGLFLTRHADTILGSVNAPPGMVVRMMVVLCLDFLLVITVIAAAIGLLDWLWQRHDHLRRNRMTRQEVMDETKDAEGDPHLRQARRQKGMAIAGNRMMAQVPAADVVIVNPTHVAVALTWSRQPGAAPRCVAKGTDHVAAAIRRAAAEAGVPIHSDPPTARALHATIKIGEEIPVLHYRAVAAAIRFADAMRQRAARRVS